MLYGDFFMDIINLINKINETYEDVYDFFKMSSMYKYADLNFTNGYCYEFFCLLKSFYPDALLMMSNDKMHCAALIKGNLYDATGLRDDDFNFHLATGSDMEYIYKYYGFFSSEFQTFLNKGILKKTSNNSKNYAKTLNKKYKYSII